MAKIIYCIKCGQKVVDGEYCPKCGSRLEDYDESDKNNKRTRNILLVVLAIALIVAAGTISYLFSLMNTMKVYKYLALPVWKCLLVKD